MKISKILLGAAMFIAAPVVKGGCQMMAQNAPAGTDCCRYSFCPRPRNGV